MNIEQKKGIIPIVFQDDSGNKKQKFEFDLFSLEPHVFKRLEEYVQSCVQINDKDAGVEEHNTEMKQSETNKGGVAKNDPSDDVQNQINEKLRENKMSLETEILDGQNFALPNQEVLAETAQGQNVPTARKLYDLQDTTSRYMEDRFLLIAKINKLENKQLRGIVPIVKSQNAGAGADGDK